MAKSRRKSKYSDEDYAAIIDRVRNGMSLRKACEPDHLPSRGAFEARLDGDESLAVQYARARETRAEGIFEEILDIADNRKGDAQRDRLRVDARKWMLGKMQPKRYGDKTTHEHTGEGGGAVEVKTTVNVVHVNADADNE